MITLSPRSLRAAFGQRATDPGARQRAVALAATVGLGGMLLLLSLSDRAPLYFKRVRPYLPLPQETMSSTSLWGLHFFAWIAMSFFAVQIARRWRGRLAIAVVLLAFGWLIEVLQVLLTEIRHYEIVDIEANVRGVIVGFTAAVGYVTLRSRIAARRHC